MIPAMNPLHGLDAAPAGCMVIVAGIAADVLSLRAFARGGAEQ